MTNIEAMKLAVHKINQSTAFDEESDELLMEALAALRQQISEAEQAEQEQLPDGFVPLQEENGVVVYAADMNPKSRSCGWLMHKHPDGQWTTARKLEDWEVMQAEDQAHYGIVLETEQAEQEPVAEVKVRPLRGNESTPKVDIEWRTRPTAGFLYTAPPKRELVDLTDDEISRALNAANVPELPDGYESVEFEIARAVIAAHKEKNRG